MRIYLPITAKELENFLAGGDLALIHDFAVTDEFIQSNSDLDSEECEYLRSVEAASSVLEKAEYGLILALEMEPSGRATPADIECLFDCRYDGDGEIELTWFGPTEIAHHLPEWLAR